MLAPRTSGPLVADAEFRHYYLPKELEERASVPLTAIIHPNSFSPMFGWIRCGERETWTWPEESGGLDTIEKILAHIKRRSNAEYVSFMEDDEENEVFPHASQYYSYRSWIADPVLKELLMPEHNRQLTEVKKCIQRVCELL